MKAVKVSVCVVSYNQAQYLDECLSSLVTQQTDFRYEIIVGDDASTDGTREVIEKYATLYPDIVVPVWHETNVGPVRNYFSVHRLARGEYVCHMDGDDLALPGKLQRQAVCLDSEPTVNIIWHRMYFFNDYGVEVEHPSSSAFYIGQYLRRSDLLLYGSVGSHSSTMYRRRCFSDRYSNFDALDWLFAVDLLGDGNGLVMQDVLGKYRVHPNGTSNGASGSVRVRTAFCAVQLELLRRYPECASIIALRALFLAGLDMIRLRPVFTKSVRVLLCCKALPALRLAGRLIQFYRASGLPLALTRS